MALNQMWCPCLDADIQETAKSCTQCLAVKNVPTVTPLKPWTWLSKPWERVHVDFVGPFQGSTLFIVVDTHSKWPEVYPMKSITAGETIKVFAKDFYI